MEVNKDLNMLFMVNYKTAGTVTVMNLNDFSINKVIPVGVGPTALAFSNTQAFVSNNSGKSISVIDLASLDVSKTIDFADGYKPQDIVYSAATDKCYMYTKTTATAKRIKVFDASNTDNQSNIDSVLEQKVIDMDITADGSKVLFVEDKSFEIEN